MDQPTIDWELGTKLAGNNPQIAEEMLALLVKTLPKDCAQIKEAYESEDNNKMIQYVHRLHGALCYCGVPRLKAAAQALEAALKQKNKLEVTSTLAIFELEVKQLLDICHARNDS